MKILIVDDELVSRSKMLKILKNVGECHVAENGRQALEMFKEAHKQFKPFDLITLDVTMPDIDGTMVLFKLRVMEQEFEVHEQEKVKVLMVTSHSDKETVFLCCKTGCDDYMLKPFTGKTVLNKLNKFGINKV